MMYPYMTLNDDTEITHSEMQSDGRVKVYIETPDERFVFAMLHVGYLNIGGKIYMLIQIPILKSFKKLLSHRRI